MILLVPKLHLGTHLSPQLRCVCAERAKRSFAYNGVPKYNLGTRGTGIVKSLITPVTAWEHPKPADAISQIKHDRQFAIKSLRLHRGEISPVTLYCYLKTRFGAPNGEMMAFRSQGSDNVVQWHYKISSNAFLLDILGTNAGLQFVAHGKSTVPDAEWSQMFEQLRCEFSSTGSAMKFARANLEKWVQFVNPFQRLEQSVRFLEEELAAIEIDPPAWPPEESRTQEHLETLRKYVENARSARRTGFCLRMLAPVYAESFVNFALYFFRNETLAESEDEYHKAVRLPINERVMALPRNCRGFCGPLQEDATEFREFLRLMNGRNALVHGNCDPTQLRVGDVFFDGTIPLWQQDGSTIVRVVEHSMEHVAKADALKDLETVRAFIRWVLAGLEPLFAEAMRQLMVSEYPGIRADTGRAGILLPNAIFESYLGPTTPPA